MSSPSFPPPVPCPGAPFPPPGPSGFGSPVSSVLRGAPTSCHPSRGARCFARRYRPRAACFAPVIRQHSEWRAWVLISRLPYRLPQDGENRISRVPVRSSRYMPCSHQTPAGPERQAIRRSRYCLPLLTRRRLPRIVDFGAQSHGLHLRCLRFAAAVTRAPRKTRFRAVASLTRTGLDPQDLFGKFPSDSSHVISSPFPEPCSAHARHSIKL